MEAVKEGRLSEERFESYLRLVREFDFEQKKAEIGLARLEKKRYTGYSDAAREIRNAKGRE